VNWKPIRLETITEVITKGTTPTTLGYDFTESGIPFLRVQNIAGGNVNYEKDTLFIDTKTHASLSRSQIQPGDILVSIAGTIGRAGVVPDNAPPLNCNQAVAIVRPTHQVFRPFLRLWIESSAAQGQIRNSTVTGTISNLSLSQLGNLGIPLPPLAEQRRIAEVLNRAEALRAKRRAALAELDSLTQSLFLDLFGDPATNPKGWPQVRLGDETTKIGSGSTPTGGETAYREEGISLIRSLNVRDGEFTFKDLAHIGDEQAAKLAGVVVEENDVLLNITGASVARVCRAPSSVLPARVNQHVCIIRPQPTLDSVFLEQFLLAEQTKRRLLKIGGAGATREAITKAQIEVFESICPPIALQQEFARRVRVVEKLKAAQRTALAEQDALFATLQHRAFRGEL
jgi:type I restriction enzyme S subunit